MLNFLRHACFVFLKLSLNVGLELSDAFSDANVVLFYLLVHLLAHALLNFKVRLYVLLANVGPKRFDLLLEIALYGLDLLIVLNSDLPYLLDLLCLLLV